MNELTVLLEAVRNSTRASQQLEAALEAFAERVSLSSLLDTFPRGSAPDAPEPPPDDFGIDKPISATEMAELLEKAAKQLGKDTVRSVINESAGGRKAAMMSQEERRIVRMELELFGAKL
jgi:hypothetical protein